MRRPYISITDFTNIKEVEEMQKVFLDCNGVDSGRYLGVGVMMSYKTLHNLPSKWSNVFPPKEKIKDIFRGGDKLLNMLHYADYEAIDVHASLEHAMMFGGSYLDCLQLDMVWPDPLILQKIKKNHRSIRLILQVGEVALDRIKNNTRKFVTKLSAYEECIDDVLLDKSMGRGLGLKADALRPFARLIARLFPRMGIVFAGGLGPDTLHLVEPLVKEFPQMSIDAQSKLRPSGSALDPIDWSLARVYLERAIALFKK